MTHKRLLTSLALAALLLGFCEQTSALSYHLSFLQSRVSTLDPIEATDTNAQLLVNHGFDGLVAWDFERGIQPALATTWTLSEDGRTYTFAMRPEARFQDGTRITAKDAKQALDRLIQTPSYFREHYRRIASVSIQDPMHLVVQLKERYPDFLLLLSGVGAKIGKRSGKQWIGSGPFIPNSFANGATLRAFPQYWGRKPGVDEIRFRVLSEGDAIGEARAGRIDELSLIPLTGGELSAVPGVWKSQPMWATWIVGMDQRVPPFDRLEVRKEFVHRLTATSFVKELYPDQVAAEGLIAFGLRGFLESSPVSWKGAEVPQGTHAEVYVPDMLARAKGICDWIERQFAPSSISVKAVPKPFSWIIERYAKGKMGAYFLSVNAEFPDPSFVVRSLHSRSDSNFLGIRDPKLDGEIDSLERTASLEEKTFRSRAIHTHLLQQAASVNLVHVTHRFWTRPCVRGLRTNPVSEGYTDYRDMVNRCH